MNSIRRQLAAKLSIGITMVAAFIFVAALGILFLYSRHLIKGESEQQAERVLHTTAQRMMTKLNLVENAVKSNSWLLEENFRPDFLQSICQRIVALNRTVKTCRVATSPDEIAQISHGYTVNIVEGDTIFTYSKALNLNGGPIEGVVIATLSYEQLSSVINAAERPSANSYFLLMDKEQRLDFDNAHVFYNALPGTDWNLVLVCPDNELMENYHQLRNLAYVLFVVGLLLILLICYLMTRRTIKPLHQLLKLSKKIVAGHYEETIPRSNRKDAIGRLQNSFAVMRQSLYEHVNSIRETGEEAKKHNQELARAMALAKDAVQKKALFIQNVSHQIRTPLNIVMGFADVLGDSLEAKHSGDVQRHLQDAELADITNTMTHNAIHLNRMVQMLSDSSELAITHGFFSPKSDFISCNTVAQECIDYTRERFPKVTIHFTTDLSDSTNILTNHLFLMRTLRELLFNAAKYSDGQHITLRITETSSTIQFIVEDVGPGVPPELQHLLFKPFVKVDDLSEGLGLGLPLSKRHALNLGGDLLYDADYHDGSRFILEIPK